MNQPGNGRVVLHLTTTDISLDLLLGPQLRAFADAGYEVIGCSAEGPHLDAIAANGIRHIPLHNSTRAMSLGADVRTAREFAGVLRQVKPHILHTHNPKPGVYGRLVGRALRVPVVVNTVHGLYAQSHDKAARKAAVYGLERIAAFASHAELVQNPEDLATLRRLRVPEDRLVLLGNGVDMSRFDPAAVPAGRREQLRGELGIAADAVVVGAVGRLVQEKGYVELIDAAVRVKQSHPATEFVFVGPHEPDKADALSSADVERAEAAGVHFLGLRDDVHELYTMFDIYVLASHREGFPRSAMEAAAMGLPLLVTDIRGSRQVVTDGRNGLVVAVNNADALTEGLTRLVNDDAARLRMGAASRERAVEQFDDRRQVEITLATYERLLGSASAK